MTLDEMLVECEKPFPSSQLLVLHTLRLWELKGQWLTIEELGGLCALAPTSAGSRLRDLRVLGFNIKRARRASTGKRVWEYKLFSRTPLEIEEANGFRSA